MAPTLTLQAALPPLSSSDKDAISDALTRAVLGLDAADVALFDSAFTPDAVFEMDGRPLSGLETIRNDCFTPISKLDTTHLITNPRVVLHEGGTTASMTATAMAQHYPPGKGKESGAPQLLSGSLYGLDLVKDDGGLWKIKYWKMKIIWADGDWSVFKTS